MTQFYKGKARTLSITLAVVLGVLLVTAAAGATTTISTDISTGGALTVTGASSFTGDSVSVQASSTRLSVSNKAYFGGTATSTFDSAGNLSVIGTLDVTGKTSLINASSTLFSVNGTAYFGGSATSTFDNAGNLTVIGTLGVTGKTSLINASSTLFSVNGTSYFGGSATSSFTNAGVLTLQNNETITNSTDGTVEIGATTLKFVGNASTSAITVGDEPAAPTINGLVFGYCSFGATSITASSSAYLNCTTTPTLALTTSDRVFVQATSSFATGFIIEAASSTGVSTINLRVLNTAISATGATLPATSINFWSVRP